MDQTNRRLAVIGRIVALIALLLGSTASAQSLATKSIAAPPSDILSGIVRRPDAMSLGVSSGAAMHPIALRPADGVWSASVRFPADDAGPVRLMIVSPEAFRWRATLRLADGSAVPLSDAAVDPRVTARAGSMTIGDDAHGATEYMIRGAAGGQWTLDVVSPLPPADPGAAVHGWLLVTSESPVSLYAAHDAPARVGEPFMLYAALYDRVATPHRTAEPAPLPVHASIRGARAYLDYGDGAAMQIDAGHFGEGWLDIRFDEPGVHTVRVVVDADLPDGGRLSRSATMLVPVTDSRATVDSASAHLAGDTVAIDLKLTGVRLPDHFLAAAEVWGTTPDGPAPACWIASMIAPGQVVGEATARLEMHADWIALGKVSAPYSLRHVRLEDAGTHVAFAGVDDLPIDLPGGLADRVAGGITPEMLTGRMDPARAVPSTQQSAAAGITLDFSAHNLMLVHGYCAGGNPFPTAQFTAPLSIFGDPNQSRTNDEFAQLLGTLGQQSKSFGIIAHSQGGLAALHLYTFYWSGLDWAQGARLIQSVGSPYQGTALAGQLAVLGSIFGTGCGQNYDMTYEGAALWLASIPTWARQQVYYHTTSFADPPGGFDYCNFLSDFFLTDPEDGVVEMSAGQLPGANNMGHKEGWCHTTGMQDPAQYLDTARNATMNASAAR